MSDVTGGTSTGSKKKQAQNDSFLPTAEIRKLWDAVHTDLRNEFGEAVFRSWLKPLTLQACYHGTLEVSVPTRFMRDWIQTHYAARILEMCGAKNADIKRLEIVVVQASPAGEAAAESAPRPAKANQNDQTTEDILGQACAFDPRFTFETFIVGKPNALAHAAARRVVESQNVPFNLSLIHI